MQEYELNVLGQYDIEVRGTRKIRGAILCDTNRGLLLLKEVSGSEKRIPALYELYEHLYNQGYTQMDQIVLTREDECVSVLEGGGKYMLKTWFQGRECDIKKPAELLESSGNLAKLHIIMCHELEQSVGAGEHLKEEYLRHNRELKKVRKYMRGTSQKGEFEFAFLKCFDQMYQWADRAMYELEHSDYDMLYEDSIRCGCMTHGEYNHHNILILQGGYDFRKEPCRIATTNFEKFKKNVQMEDLYYFLRKIMEKHGWKTRLGDSMLNAYSAIRPISDREMEYLKIRLAYPEKIWKIANSYYHSNKAWIPEKNIEKLNTAIRQTEEKSRFLEEIFAFHL